MKNVQESSLALTRLEKSLVDLNDLHRKHRDYIKRTYKISALELEIVQLIITDGKKKMREIGEHFNIKLSTLTSIIDKIERQKLVKRVNSKQDRRVVHLDVTKKGIQVNDEYSKYLHLLSRLVQESMEKEQFEIFVEGFEKFSRIKIA